MLSVSVDTVGATLWRLRMRHAYTQTEAGALATPPVSQASYCRWERGETLPPLDKILSIYPDDSDQVVSAYLAELVRRVELCHTSSGPETQSTTSLIRVGAVEVGTSRQLLPSSDGTTPP